MNKFDRKKAKENNAKIVKAPKVRLFGDSRDTTGSKPTMPARQRPGQTYAGGKKLRRALRRLAASQAGSIACQKASKKGASAYKMPGAMNP